MSQIVKLRSIFKEGMIVARIWPESENLVSAGGEEPDCPAKRRTCKPFDKVAWLAWPGDPKNVSGGGKSSSKAETQLSGTTAQSTEPPEPPLDHPISPDEQRGFPRPPQWQDKPGKEEP
jgi:hypothetical protein